MRYTAIRKTKRRWLKHLLFFVVRDISVIDSSSDNFVWILLVRKEFLDCKFLQSVPLVGLQTPVLHLRYKVSLRLCGVDR